ncbi:uncharacterized protein LOC135834944 [Planococcus citri]|uniref:uncharacterized protein LOC135834944 n=1 Tax=Planococcus citri TaxID=170843 RepID=UPI0031FA47B2
MTFKTETNSKDEKNNSDSQTPATATVTNERISTIYDPRQRCSPIPSFTASLFSGQQHQVDGADKKNTLMEKIKKITFNLRLKKCRISRDSDLNRRKINLICCSTLLTCTTLIMLTAFIYFLNTVQKTEIRDIIVDGEFQILNAKFDYEMLDKRSMKFREISTNLTRELNKLFRWSDVGEYFKRSEILEIAPNMTIKSIVVFHNSDNINVGRIGLAFLRSLRLQHGHTYLGAHTINVQSIGFQIRGEEGVWGEWSEWSGCSSINDTVATRTRQCYTRDTFQVTNVDRCLLIPGNKGDLDILPCKKFKAMVQRKENEMAVLFKKNDDTLTTDAETIQSNTENSEYSRLRF